MSASNRRQAKASADRSGAPVPMVLRCARACVNGFAGLVQGIQSEVINGLASHHMANHAYRFVLTQRDTILVQRDRGGQTIVQAEPANVQPSSQRR